MRGSISETEIARHRSFSTNIGEYGVKRQLAANRTSGSVLEGRLAAGDALNKRAWRARRVATSWRREHVGDDRR